MHPSIAPWLEKINHPASASRKGQNGKAIVIGGSDLFHAASQWSFKAASRWLDMLFYSSVAENNELIHQAKQAMTDGVVVPRAELPEYLTQVDAVLIGPGMRRDEASRFSEQELNTISLQELNSTDWEADTRAVTSVLLRTFPDKKWVIDAGSLQILQREWLPPSAVLTPHLGEFSSLLERWSPEKVKAVHEAVTVLTTGVEAPSISHDAEVHDASSSPAALTLKELAGDWSNAIVLLKGPVDIVFNATTVTLVTGGNAGLTKGGTGDALAGLVLGLSATSDSYASAVVATATVKQAAHQLFQTHQEMYNTSDVVDQLPLAFTSAQKDSEHERSA